MRTYHLVPTADGGLQVWERTPAGGERAIARADWGVGRMRVDDSGEAALRLARALALAVLRPEGADAWPAGSELRAERCAPVVLRLVVGILPRGRETIVHELEVAQAVARAEVTGASGAN